MEVSISLFESPSLYTYNSKLVCALCFFVRVQSLSILCNLYKKSNDMQIQSSELNLGRGLDGTYIIRPVFITTRKSKPGRYSQLDNFKIKRTYKPCHLVLSITTQMLKETNSVRPSLCKQGFSILQVQMVRI